MEKAIQFPPVVARPVYAAGDLNAVHSKLLCRNQKALVNPDTGHVYSVVGSVYKVISHEDLVLPVYDAVLKIDPKACLEVDFPDCGAKVWAKIKMLGRVYEVGRYDNIHPTIEIRGSYDRMWASTLNYGGFRLVCSNGMVVGVDYNIVYTAHNQLFDMENVIEMVKDSHDVFTAQIVRWREWQQEFVTPIQYERIVDGMGFTRRQLDSIEHRVEKSSQKMIEDMKYRTLSTWDLYNIVTEDMTHAPEFIKNRRKRAEQFQRLAKVMA